jgi:glycosyltransferase involved in cell wall biosynthesis
VKVLVVSNLYPPIADGGYEMRCAGIVEHLQNRHEVQVLTSDHRADEAPAANGVARTLPFLVPGPSVTPKAPLLTATAIQAMRRALRGFKPDIVYCFSLNRVPQAVLLEAMDTGTPCALDMGDYWLDRFALDDPFLRWLPTLPTAGPYSKASGRARVLAAPWRRTVMAINRAHPSLRVRLPPRHTRIAIKWVSRFLQDATHVPDWMDVVHQAVVLPATRHSARFTDLVRAPESTGKVLYMGRVAEDKGAFVAVDALAAMLASGLSTARLVFAGPCDPGFEAQLKQHARDRAAGEHVTFLGSIDSDGLAKELATADALLVPSVWDEPAGNVCLEGMLARVPIVAAHVGGIPEILREDVDALLFSRGDAAGAASALLACQNDPVSAQTRVDAAAQRAASLSYARHVCASEEFLAGALRALRSG